MSVPISQDCRGRDGTSHTWCASGSMLDASPVTSAQPKFPQAKGPGQLGPRLGCALRGCADMGQGAPQPCLERRGEVRNNQKKEKSRVWKGPSELLHG